jgi:hypothetical protein
VTSPSPGTAGAPGRRREPRHRRRPRAHPRAAIGAAVGVIAAVVLTLGLARITDVTTPTSGGTDGAGGQASVTPDGRLVPAPGEIGSGRGQRPQASPDGDGHDGSGRPGRGGRSSPAAGGCPAFPAFPDENCTGYRHTGVDLRPCPNVIEDDGVTLDGCRFGPDLTIIGQNVTITRSLVEGTVNATYLTEWSLGGLTLIDVEIDGKNRIVDGRTAAIGNDDYTCIRCHIHSSNRGANLGWNVHIEESLLHGWYHSEGAHQTAIGSNGGGNFTIIHNNLECAEGLCSAALALYPDFEPIDGALIQHNLFNTDGGYCTYGGAGSNGGSNVRFIDNVYGDKFFPECGEYGAVVSFQPGVSGNEWRGNRFADGSPVPPPA